MEGGGEGGFRSFLKWAADLGVTDSSSNSPPTSSSSSCLGQSLCVSHFPDAGGRGLAAARDVKRGELLLRVPKCALMTRESLMKDHRLYIAVNRHLYLSSTQILTVSLLYEAGKGRNSWWYPYLMQMPRSYDILASFGSFEIQSLQVNDAIWAAEKATEKVESDWNQAIALMEELHLKHHLRILRAWHWAFATISSRTLHIPWDDAGCLCPVGDLFNYAPPGEEADYHNVFTSENSSCWRTIQIEDVTGQGRVEQINVNSLRLTDGGYEEDTSTYCFYARRDYKKGEQVLLSYGTYTNLELLEHYGFLLSTNPNEKAFIPLEPGIYSSCSWPKDSLFVHQNGTPSFALLSALRLWLTPPNQRRSVGHLVYSGSQLSSENEMIVMRWIAKNCRLILENLPTSIHEDKLLIHTIDKMQDSGALFQIENVVAPCESEVRAFWESKSFIDGETKFLVKPRHIKRCMDQCKLAVQWRLGYKQTLADCITYCAKVMDELSENGMMTENNLT